MSETVLYQNIAGFRKNFLLTNINLLKLIADKLYE